MTIFAVIPARSGSKRVPKKNVATCAGRPLLAWSVMAAKAAKTIDRIILSTDDESVAVVGRACGIEVPWLRPPDFAGDDVPMIAVLRHALDWIESRHEVEAIVLLQPTSPLRIAADIDGAIDLFRATGADSVVTVTTIPNAFKPEKIMLRDNECAVAPFSSPSAKLGQLVVRNGPAVVVVRPDVLRTGELYGSRTLCYEMPQERSIDIDTPFDFLMAELLLEHRQHLSGDFVC